MKVRVISKTMPVQELVEEGVNDITSLVAFCARVSNPSNQLNTNTADKLLAYLIKNKHWSPLQMCDVCMEIETTRDIGRQILRHASFSFQEFSQRYADPVKELEFTFREARLQDTKNRQNSIEINDPNLQANWQAQQQAVLNAITGAYNWAIQNGIAKEVARAVLPEGLTVSRLYVKGSIRSWIHFIEVRTDPTTQKEHRELAIACAKELAALVPLVAEHVHKDGK